MHCITYGADGACVVADMPIISVCHIWWCLIAKPNHVIITLEEVQVLSRSLYFMKCVKHKTFAVQVSKTFLSNISKAKNKARAMGCREVSVSLHTVSRCTATWLCTQSNLGISCFPCVTSYK